MTPQSKQYEIKYANFLAKIFLKMQNNGNMPAYIVGDSLIYTLYILNENY